VDKALSSATSGETEVSILAPVSRDFHVLVAPLHSSESDAPPDIESLTAEQPAVALSLHEITEIRRAESMRADFVANASHELKTPLANLVGFIETLKGPARDDQDARDRFLDIMQAEASRMSRLINDLLSLSRIEQGEHMQPSTPVDVASLLEAVVRLMELRAGKQDVKIELDLPEGLNPIQGDSDQLMQVFQNLLDNALKYSQPGTSIHIRVKTVDRLPQGRLAGVIISVEDEGEGIPTEHLPRLTERFYRVDTGRSRKLGGTGLGLAIVKHIARRHRGWLDIESEVGKGTTVSIGLPYIQQAAMK
jgi:two-component system phosphate regulon sensor histidine kinase PhoR